MRIVIVLALAACGGGGKGGGLGGDCAGLPLAECRLTFGCVPDLCSGCFCDLNYRGCLQGTDTPAECPALGCPSARCCQTQEQCQQEGDCTVPGADEGCGACNPAPGDCIDDTGCTGTSICEPIRCSCNGESACVPGCLDNTDCPDLGTECEVATSRCVGSTCGVGVDCPPDFDCQDTRCVRRSCDDDLDCDGFCVVGSCFGDAIGECRLPVP